MRRVILAISAAAFAAAAAAPVLAGPPGGVPPGLAKKGVSPREWQAWKGRRLPDRDYVVIRDYDRYGLRRPRPGYDYYVVDGTVLRVLVATREVAEAVGAVSDLLRR